MVLIRMAESMGLDRKSASEPMLVDLFITRTLEVFALSQLVVPTELARSRQHTELTTPASFLEGRYRQGRHLFETGRHIYLDCEVEGPFINPHWGLSSAAARP